MLAVAIQNIIFRNNSCLIIIVPLIISLYISSFILCLLHATARLSHCDLRLACCLSQSHFCFNYMKTWLVMERHSWHVRGTSIPCHAMEFKPTYFKSALSMLGSASSDLTQSHFWQPDVGNMRHSYNFEGHTK